jgi:hypothetical protein
MSYVSRFSCLVAVLVFGNAVRAQDTFTLREQFSPAYQYHVSSRVELAGRLTMPAEKGKEVQSLQVTGQSALEYDERILTRSSDQNVEKTIRYYGRMDFERKVGDQVQQNSLRPEVRRLVILRHKQVEVPFAPAGPLTWGEIDMVRTDVFTPALAGLLPDKAVKVGNSWQAQPSAVQEITDFEKIEEGGLTCKLESIVSLSKRRHARVSFNGTIRGLGDDGLAKHQLDGFFFFDLESNHLSYLSMKGVHSMMDKSGATQGKIEGTFVLTRQPSTRSKELSDEALRGLALEPNDENTLLLFDNEELGVRFLYPRRWRLAGVNGRQIGLDETRGNGGLLMTVEALPRVPTGPQYLQESQNWLTQQKAKVVKSDRPTTLQNPPQALEYFTIEADVKDQRIRLAYYVIRQPLGGATLAARLVPTTDITALERDVQRIARSLQITRKQ